MDAKRRTTTTNRSGRKGGRTPTRESGSARARGPKAFASHGGTLLRNAWLRNLSLAVLGVFLGFGILSSILPSGANVSQTREERPAPAPPAVRAPVRSTSDPAPDVPVAVAPEPAEETRKPWHRERAVPGIRPAPNYFPRPENEWQGMLVELSSQAVCGEVDSCGLAMACIDHQCGPCVADSECASGEMCVLDHCVEARNVECKTTSECRDGELCVLSGYSSDIRSNRDMVAFCQPDEGGDDSERELELERERESEMEEAEMIPRPISIDDLRSALLADDEWIDGAPALRSEIDSTDESMEPWEPESEVW